MRLIHRPLLAAALMTASLLIPLAASAVDVQAFVRKDRFSDIKLSPNGDYYAATVPFEDQTGLVIIRRADNAMTGSFRLGKNTHINDFWWVNPERVLISTAEKFGSLDMPRLTGELYAINADGTRTEFLIGQRMHSDPARSGKRADLIAAYLVDDLPNDDKSVVITVHPFNADPYTRAERLDVYTGRRTPLARAPVRNADFVTDHTGTVRFATGAGTDGQRKLYYRASGSAQWQLINDETATHRIEWPVGFSADDKTAYMTIEQDQGPDIIIEYDIATGSRKTVLKDDVADPDDVIYRNGTSVPVGAFFTAGKPRAAFFDDSAPEARLYRSLEDALGEGSVQITSQTTDGRLALVLVSSDRNPGDYYIFDTAAKKAQHLLSRRDWFDPARMAGQQPIQLIARDGLPLHGYLTTPNGTDGKKLPMVVMPHGGPFGVRDDWGFDNDAQILAQAGYAVLQVNFRGSGGYGRAFTHAGIRQWGGAMQDDLTDATRWAIEHGYADSGRICIYGASYGGYAALMGVAKEPDLYRCAAGYVGVYDLPTMHTHGDIQQIGSGQTYLREWIGARDQLAAVSPTHLAERIKVPVFLAAGGADDRAPIEHSRMMERALRTAGIPVETLYYDTEGHGFYVEAHQREYYTRLLAFLARNLGGAVATNRAGEETAAQ